MEAQEHTTADIENNSDSGLEECGTSPISSGSFNRTISPNSYYNHDITHIPFRPQVITQSESSAFMKIEKLVNACQIQPAFPPLNLGAPPGIGYLPGYFLPPWTSGNANSQICLQQNQQNNNAETNNDTDTDNKTQKELSKDVFNEVNTSIPFSNYFQNLTELLQKSVSQENNRVKDECESEPGEVSHRENHDRPNIYSPSASITRNVKLEEEETRNENKPNTQQPAQDFPNLQNGQLLSMSHLLGMHPYFSASTQQITQTSQGMQYLGMTQPPAGLLHPAFLHMAGLRGRRLNTEKPPPIKKYKCDVCGKAFSRSNTLVTHKRIHTGDKPFKCESCGRAFRQPGNLTRHRLTHTTVKPYVCPTCNKAFNRASNLHTHMRTHTSFKPYTCTYCGKGFHQKIDMKIHCYTHTGERPHRCDICGKGFTLISALNAHRRIHTENMPVSDMS